MNSSLFKLKLPDWAKGLTMAVIGAVTTAVYQAITSGGFEAVDWKAVGAIAVTTGLSYLIKNFFSDEQGKVFGSIG